MTETADKPESSVARPLPAHPREPRSDLYNGAIGFYDTQGGHPDAENQEYGRRDDGREATELDDYARPSTGNAGSSVSMRGGKARAVYDDDGETRDSHPQVEAGSPGADLTERPTFARLPTTPRQARKSSWLRRFWRHHVRVAVPHEKCRDHLALERTFLGYVRTSTMVANVGVTVAALLRLQSDPVTTPGFSFYNSGRGLGAMMVFVAISIVLIGGWRFYRQQNAMTRGKVYAAGWELHAVGWLYVAVIAVLFIVVLAVPYTG